MCLMGTGGFHIPVLLNEVLYYLGLKKGDYVFDGTLGGAGHTVEIIKAIAPTGKVIGVDLNSQTVRTAAKRLGSLLRFAILINDNFANIKNILKELNIGKINGILLDLGLSSYLIEESGRGFSYLKNEKLDMRFGDSVGLTAYELLNSYSQGDLEDLFRRFGEELYSKGISKAIIDYRKKGKINTTGELVQIIEGAIPGKARYGKSGHPAKRVFQAVRIGVNRELDNLQEAIKDGFDVLSSGGRMAVISYHSLEDRIVKRSFLSYTGKCICPPDFPVCVCGRKKTGRIITKKAVRPGEKEVMENPRSKSAKLRVIEKI
ncbi:MAG: 16S rRNA (cytosine(1402)-N(4))-methyltransferase RsmH [Actinobacteria bacterium]|nr:16S rRNA (cytosine(1402)-N(4))-methyltransferase RsmH [Actinomycetota bacterium]